MTTSSDAIKNWIGLITHPYMSYSEKLLCVLYHYPDHKVDRVSVSNLSTWMGNSVRSVRPVDVILILSEMRGRGLIKQVNFSSVTGDPQNYTVSLKLTPQGIQTARNCVDLYNIVIPDGYSNPMTSSEAAASSSDVSDLQIIGLHIEIIVKDHSDILKYDIALSESDQDVNSVEKLVSCYTQRILCHSNSIYKDLHKKNQYHVIAVKDIVSLSIQVINTDHLQQETETVPVKNERLYDPSSIYPPVDIAQLSRVFAAVEATNFEQMALYQTWSPAQSVGVHAREIRVWEEDSVGLLLTIGTFADHPVSIQIRFVTLDGHLVMFWESPSQITNHLMVDQWLNTYVGTEHRATDTFHTTDCMNFHTLVHAIKRRTTSQTDVSLSPLVNTSGPSEELVSRIATVTTGDMSIDDRILSILSTYAGGYRDVVDYSELKHWFGVPDLTDSSISGTLRSLRDNGMVVYSYIDASAMHTHIDASTNYPYIVNIQLTLAGASRAESVRFFVPSPTSGL